MGRLLIAEGCELRVIDLPGTEKGVDDFIVAQGQVAFHALYNTAETLELWEIKLFTLLTYPSAIAVENPYLIKICLNVTVSEKLTPVAIAQKLLDKIDLRLSYVERLGPREKRECVYQFVHPDDGRNVIFDSWLNRDELSNCELVSVTNNIELQIDVSDTHNIPQTLNKVESPAVCGRKGLKLRLQQGLKSAGQLYQQLISKVGEAIGVADGEPIWNGYLGNCMISVSLLQAVSRLCAIGSSV